VRKCLSLARTSSGSLFTDAFDTTNFGRRLVLSGGIMDVGVLPHGASDIGHGVALIGFTSGRAEADEFVRWVREVNAANPLSPSGLLDAERRGNAILVRFDYDPELRRIIHGCLGGPGYRGNGLVPPPDDGSGSSGP
jgi:hypothetical protein